MKIKVIKLLSFFSLVLILCIFIVYRLTSYTPPLLRTENGNVFDHTIDFTAFGYHNTKASILSDYLKNSSKASIETANAAWYRKNYFFTKFEIDEEDFDAIVDIYKNLKIAPILVELYSYHMKRRNSDTDLLLESGAFFLDIKKWKLAIKALSKIL